MLRVSLALCVLALGSALELTPDNFDEATSGKTVFIKVSRIFARSDFISTCDCGAVFERNILLAQRQFLAPW